MVVSMTTFLPTLISTHSMKITSWSHEIFFESFKDCCCSFCSFALASICFFSFCSSSRCRISSRLDIFLFLSFFPAPSLPAACPAVLFNVCFSSEDIYHRQIGAAIVHRHRVFQSEGTMHPTNPPHTGMQPKAPTQPTMHWRANQSNHMHLRALSVSSGWLAWLQPYRFELGSFLRLLHFVSIERDRDKVLWVFSFQVCRLVFYNTTTGSYPCLSLLNLLLDYFR